MNAGGATQRDNQRREELCQRLGAQMPRGKVGGFVFQQTKPESANCTEYGDPRLQIRKHVIPFDPMTRAQIAQRRKVREAASAWRRLLPRIRAQLIFDADGKADEAYRAFIKPLISG